ncbi:MAG: MHYT domain-containing protein [Alphaproteobacteria bacterium]
MMTISYDLVLVGLSLVIASFAAYTCFHLADRMDGSAGVARKAMLAGAAVAMGGGIWSMHFVGMLAVRLPLSVGYDLLLTLISALTSILVTGIALVLTSIQPLPRPRLVAGGVFMGLGIASMHYIGMAAMRIEAAMTYDATLVAVSVAIAVAASSVALWLAFNLRGVRLRMAAAAVMGAAISGMHYTAMAAVDLVAATGMPAPVNPTLSQPQLASIIALATFLIFGFTLLTAVPDRRGARRPTSATPDPEPLGEGENPRLLKLPVQKNKTTLFIGLDDVVNIQADAHYTTVFTRTGRYFCPMSLTDLESRLDPTQFLRVHRSHVVNIRHAKSFERQNEHAVILLDGYDDRPVPVSRGRVTQLRHALGI